MKKASPHPAPSGPAASLRSYLFLTAAITGGAIMVVEILGARMLSPFMGTSHFVWTAQIAVTLVALACGYYVGGRWSDRSPKLDGLYWAILAAALYLVLTVPMCESVAYGCLKFRLAVGSLLASAFLFFVPLGLLAMTGPFLVRVITANVNGVGGNVGRLTAIGTVGSFLGTLLVSYVLVPFLPNSTSMYLTAAILILTAAGYFLVFQRATRKGLTAAATVGAVTLTLFLAGNGRANGRFRELFRGNSHFGELQVLERTDGRFRLFSNDNLIQNTYDPELRLSASTFTYLLAGLGRTYTTNVQDVLCIGMGVGIVPMDFARQGARVDVVEINPAVPSVATRYFDFEPGKVQITIDDGRHFLNRAAAAQYDVVVLDAFLGDSSPSHLMTREAFEAIHHTLRPDGTLVINAFCELERERNFFAASLNRTLRSVFKGVRMHYGGGQIYFVATDRPEPGFVRQPDLAAVHPSVQSAARNAYETVVDTDPRDGRVLTDDFNPVEFYDAANREQVRRQLALSARRLEGF